MDSGIVLLIFSVVIGSYLTLLGLISGFYIVILQRFRAYWTSRVFPEQEFAVRRRFRFLLIYYLVYSAILLNGMALIGVGKISDVWNFWIGFVIGGFVAGLWLLYRLITKMEEVVMFPPPFPDQPEKTPSAPR